MQNHERQPLFEQQNRKARDFFQTLINFSFDLEVVDQEMPGELVNQKNIFTEKRWQSQSVFYPILQDIIVNNGVLDISIGQDESLPRNWNDFTVLALLAKHTANAQKTHETDKIDQYNTAAAKIFELYETENLFTQYVAWFDSFRRHAVVLEHEQNECSLVTELIEQLKTYIHDDDLVVEEYPYRMIEKQEARVLKEIFTEFKLKMKYANSYAIDMQKYLKQRENEMKQFMEGTAIHKKAAEFSIDLQMSMKKDFEEVLEWIGNVGIDLLEYEVSFAGFPRLKYEKETVELPYVYPKR